MPCENVPPADSVYPQDVFQEMKLSKEFRWEWLTLLSALAATGCGGGPNTASAPAPSPAPGSLQANISAATATANDNPLCSAITPFYWEIGNGTGPLASGSRGSVTASTQMSIASASKWIYGTYVVQAHGGADSSDFQSHIPYLNFTSGYSNLGNVDSVVVCNSTDTVQSCMSGQHGAQDPSTVNHFYYDSGHMQEDAILEGLGADDSQKLAADVKSVLGSDISFAYTAPLLAGGVYTDATNYGAFLRKILNGDLKMHDALDKDAVCTNPAQSGCNALSSPVPTTESWHYSIGHWIEDDPNVGDGAYSSAGAFGFYPWIDKTITYYGIVAREDQSISQQQHGYESAQCGRLIRQAWKSGIEQTGTAPAF